MFPESPVCTLYDDTKRNGFWVTGGEPGVIEVLKVWKWPIVHRSKFWPICVRAWDSGEMGWNAWVSRSMRESWQPCVYDWRFMCPLSAQLSMHQFIESSRCVIKWNKFKHFDVERPVKVCAPTGLPVHRRRNYRRTKLPSSVWEENKFRGFPHETPCPSCTDVQVDV